MTNYAYTRNIPANNHNPAVDQPPMRTNTNSTADLISEDHYSFGVANGGFHKQLRFPDLAAIGNLAPRIADSGTLWTQKADSIAPTQESNLFYVPDLTNDSYQLTRTITSQKTLFGLLTEDYPGSALGFFGGWTFLPGGMLFQYGYVDTSTSNIVIPFPVTFKVGTTPFTIQVTASVDDNSGVRMGVLAGSESATTFTTNNTGTGHLKRIYWQAIGI